MNQNFCSYYQALVVPEKTYLFVATFRSNEHVAFDRTRDKKIGLFEFFVPNAQEELFLKLLARYEQLGIVRNLQKLPNRLAEPGAVL